MISSQERPGALPQWLRIGIATMTGLFSSGLVGAGFEGKTDE